MNKNDFLTVSSGYNIMQLSNMFHLFSISELNY